MEKYILDGQYGKYLEMIGVKVGEALKASGVPEDLFGYKKPTRPQECFGFINELSEKYTQMSIFDL